MARSPIGVLIYYDSRAVQAESNQDEEIVRFVINEPEKFMIPYFL